MDPDFSHINLAELFDMLSEQTGRYLKMLSEGASRDDFNKCRETIIDIQAEIQARQAQGGGHPGNATFKR